MPVWREVRRGQAGGATVVSARPDRPGRRATKPLALSSSTVSCRNCTVSGSVAPRRADGLPDLHEGLVDEAQPGPRRDEGGQRLSDAGADLETLLDEDVGALGAAHEASRARATG